MDSFGLSFHSFSILSIHFSSSHSLTIRAEICQANPAWFINYYSFSYSQSSNEIEWRFIVLVADLESFSRKWTDKTHISIHSRVVWSEFRVNVFAKLESTQNSSSPHSIKLWDTRKQTHTFDDKNRLSFCPFNNKNLGTISIIHLTTERPPEARNDSHTFKYFNLFIWHLVIVNSLNGFKFLPRG